MPVGVRWQLHEYAFEEGDETKPEVVDSKKFYPSHRAYFVKLFG